MMPRILYTLMLFLILGHVGQTQAVFYLNSGSRANTGTTQQLTIRQNGQALYILREVNGRSTDSISFTISSDQLNSIFQKARDIGFYALDKKYDGRKADGWGIYISINDRGNKKQVDVLNMIQPAIKEFVVFLNNLLSAHKIRIRYEDVKVDSR